jgi:hypothetical protein
MRPPLKVTCDRSRLAISIGMPNALAMIRLITRMKSGSCGTGCVECTPSIESLGR